LDQRKLSRGGVRDASKYFSWIQYKKFYQNQHSLFLVIAFVGTISKFIYWLMLPTMKPLGYIVNQPTINSAGTKQIPNTKIHGNTRIYPMNTTNVVVGKTDVCSMLT